MPLDSGMSAKQPSQRSESGELRLWRIGVALAVSFTVALAGLAGLTVLAWVLVGAFGFRRHGAPSLHDTVGVLQLVFASVAGAGALVALVVAYRRQKVAEADSAHDRARVFNERFTSIAAQLGDDQPAVRLAGVHAMAGLADDWTANRQTCIDVLCAYLRMPYEPDPGDDAPAAERLKFRAIREVRHTVIRVITSHLREDAVTPWNDRDLDFTGVIFDGGDFSKAIFASKVKFTDAEFSSGIVWFTGAQVSGGEVYFDGAKFSGGRVDFSGAAFSGGRVDFSGAKFSGGEIDFGSADFSGSEVDFSGTTFSGGRVNFSCAAFSGSEIDFGSADFSGSEVDFSHIRDWSVRPKYMHRAHRPQA